MGHPAPLSQQGEHNRKMRKLAQEWDRLYQGPPRKSVPWKLLLSCVSGALGFAAVIAGSFNASPWLLTIGFSLICVAGVIPIEAADRQRAHPKLKKRQQSVKPDLLAPIYAAYELDRITLAEFERCIDFELRKQEGMPQPLEHGTLMSTEQPHQARMREALEKVEKLAGRADPGRDWQGTLPEFDSQGRLVSRSPLISGYVGDYEMRPFLTDEEIRTEIANDAVDSLGRPWGDQLKRVYR